MRHQSLAISLFLQWMGLTVTLVGVVIYRDLDVPVDLLVTATVLHGCSSVWVYDYINKYKKHSRHHITSPS